MKACQSVFKIISVSLSSTIHKTTETTWQQSPLKDRYKINVYFLTKGKLDKINLSNTMFTKKINIDKKNLQDLMITVVSKISHRFCQDKSYKEMYSNNF